MVVIIPKSLKCFLDALLVVLGNSLRVLQVVKMFLGQM